MKCMYTLLYKCYARHCPLSDVYLLYMTLLQKHNVPQTMDDVKHISTNQQLSQTFRESCTPDISSQGNLENLYWKG
jgi:hypothetical protein